MINKKIILTLSIILIVIIAISSAVATNIIPNPLHANNTTNTTNNITHTNNTTTSNESNNTSITENNNDGNTNNNVKYDDSDNQDVSSDEYVAEWDEATHRHDGSDFRMDQPYRYDDEGNIHLRRYNEKTGENYWT